MLHYTNILQHQSVTARGVVQAETEAATLTRHKMEMSGISTDKVSLSCVFMADAARPVGSAWSWEVAMVIGVAGGAPGSGPITRFSVLSTKHTMDRTCETCQGDSQTCTSPGRIQLH